MSRFFDRWLPCGTLLAWSAILLGFALSGRIASFLHPMFRPGVLIAGIALLLLAVTLAFLRESESCCEHDHCGQPLGRKTAGRVLTFGILILPICAAAMFSRDEFGASTIANRGLIESAEALGPGPRGVSSSVEPPLPRKDGAKLPEQAAAPESFLPRTKEGNVALQVIDLLYAAQDASLRADFEGRKVEMIGQLMADNTSNTTGRRFKLVRMFMMCCAADARPVATLVEADAPPPAVELSWIKVIGTATFPLEGGRTIAVVKAESVVPTTPPDETMLY